MDIKVKEDSLGECVVKSYVDIEKDVQYLIKALCVMQIMCINSREDQEKSKKFFEIIRDAADKADRLFNSEIQEMKIDATEQFC